MQIPSSLQNAIEEIAAKIPLSSLKSAYQQISEAYHRGEASDFLFTHPTQILAYLLARLPATYAAVYSAMQSLIERLPEWNCCSVLDIGSGPGTASWAAAELFPDLSQITLLEKSEPMIAIGKQLASYSEGLALQNSHWLQQDLTKRFALPKADLTIFSYVFAEIDCLDLIQKTWEQGTSLLIVEPGTPKGFANILAARKKLIELGAFIAAPCPHHFACPIAGWCHFPARVERTKVHKLLKEGSLGYEDEKYSYVAASPLSPLPVEGRVVSSPLKLSGHVKLSLCTREGQIEQKTVTRKQKEIYRRARDAEWSSIWM
jgi:ribosomal protein RSM22 (predicted rRNA methylase)